MSDRPTTLLAVRCRHWLALGATLALSACLPVPEDRAREADTPWAMAQDTGEQVEPVEVDAVELARVKSAFQAPGPYGSVIERNVGEALRNTHVDVASDAMRCAGIAERLGLSGIDPALIAVFFGNTLDADRQLYTLYRPEKMREGERYPVVSWGNGTCENPLGYQALLRHLASHGVIVIAANTGWVGGGVEMRRALDFVLAEDARAGSVLYGKVDTARLGSMGHSQGSSAAVLLGGDARVVTSVGIQGARAEQVARLRGPVFLIAGERDPTVLPAGVETAFRAATVPAVYGLSLGQDHGMPAWDPTPIRGAVAAWLRLQLAGDQAARPLFVGEHCGYCDDPAWRLQRQNL